MPSMYDWKTKLGIDKDSKVEDSSGNRYTVVSFGSDGYVNLRDSHGRGQSIFGGFLRRAGGDDSAAFEITKSHDDSSAIRRSGWKFGV